ncbi:MAG: hypothetical protein M1812_000752 [Candelaria pacifica]|nr:MAG: hypothetical protein M1812_000752 [Candelaria pacifica]
MSLVSQINRRGRLLTSKRQNLIPLLIFRPLRLFVPPDQLRSARIILLKATHFPFVAAIRLYESAQRYFSGIDRHRQTTQGPSSTLKRPFLVRNDSLLRSPLSAGLQPALKGRSVLGRTTDPHADERRSNPPVAEASSTISDLIAVVEKLSSQVEELTVTITNTQQRKTEDDE